MTEYIIIVAVIGIASIAIYTLYGDVLRPQTAAAAVALSGQDGSAAHQQAEDTSLIAREEADVGRNMENFAENPTPHGFTGGSAP